jgi:GNAT superfamily N-acetyltransferase
MPGLRPGGPPRHSRARTRRSDESEMKSSQIGLGGAMMAPMTADPPASQGTPRGAGKRSAARKRARPGRSSGRSGNARIPAKAPGSRPGAPQLPLERKFGGHPAVLRLLGPADRDTLLEFFESHTRETIHLRYGYELSQISEARAAELVGVDQSKDAAIGIFEKDQKVPLVAIGRYCLRSDGESAEIAFVVREDRRGLGMATTLLGILLRIAASRGLKTFVAQVLRENLEMFEVFARFGGTRTPISGTDSDRVSIDVAGARRRLPR